MKSLQRRPVLYHFIQDPFTQAFHRRRRPRRGSGSKVVLASRSSKQMNERGLRVSRRNGKGLEASAVDGEDGRRVDEWVQRGKDGDNFGFTGGWVERARRNR